jgi:hypothetical protein
VGRSLGQPRGQAREQHRQGGSSRVASWPSLGAAPAGRELGGSLAAKLRGNLAAELRSTYLLMHLFYVESDDEQMVEATHLLIKRDKFEFKA